MSKRKRLFFDTEFTGLHQYTTLISIGLVSEDGHSFYAEFTDYDKKQVNSWIKTHVISNLEFKRKPRSYFEIINNLQWQVKGDRGWVKNHLTIFLNQFESVEMWSDNLAYDWVLFCQLFDHAFNIPKQVYYIPFDLSTMLELKGIDPDINRADFVKQELKGFNNQKKHNALWDAMVIEKCFAKARQTK